MKKSLLATLGLLSCMSLMAQTPVVLEQHATMVVENTDVDENLANKKGDKIEYDNYYTRRTGMQVDSLVLQVGQFKLALKSTTTNELFWKEIGNWYPFWGDARILGCRIGYARRKQMEDADNYDLSIYHASDPKMTEPDEILVARSFAGYQINVGSELDSFTYIDFKSSDFTNVKNGFMVSVSLQEVTPFGDELDIVSLYSSMKGDGKGEHRAMVKLTNESLVWQGKEYARLDELFSDGQGGFYQFDYDIMIIPIMDVEAGIGFVDMKGVKYNGHFPNPAKTQFTIDLDVAENQDNFKITIQTIGGQTLKTINTGYLPSGKQLVNVDVSDLAAGSYIYVIETDKSVLSSMVIVAD